ncbi:hypothetical protein BHE74_00026811 [Ensete ventricosum]|nr:hypothetical protein BHE74_00026811 [Ensete ventricosum]
MDAHLNRCTVGEQGSEGGGGGGGREEEAVKLSSLASSQLKESLLWHLWRSPREEEGEVVQSVELEEEASMGSSQPGLTCSDNDTDHMFLESYTRYIRKLTSAATLPCASPEETARSQQRVLKTALLLQSDPEVIHGRCIDPAEPSISTASVQIITGIV